MYNKDFDYKKFKEIISSSDYQGLMYLYDNEIRYYNCLEVRQEYIYQLWRATIALNVCNNIYETIEFENNFEFDVYMNTRNKLLEELSFIIEDLYN